VVFDNSAFPGMSGSTRTSLLSSLLFLGLVDEDRRPTSALKVLAEDPSSERLRRLLENAYSVVLAIPLERATAAELDAALRAMGTPPSQLPRARAFVLQACDEAGLPIGPQLQKAMARRGRAAQPIGSAQSRSTFSGRRRRGATATHAPPDISAFGWPPLVQALVEKLPTERESWSKEGLNTWFAVARQTFPYAYGLDFDSEDPQG
jgi:hypothetical protein